MSISSCPLAPRSANLPLTTGFYLLSNFTLYRLDAWLQYPHFPPHFVPAANSSLFIYISSPFPPFFPTFSPTLPPRFGTLQIPPFFIYISSPFPLLFPLFFPISTFPFSFFFPSYSHVPSNSRFSCRIYGDHFELRGPSMIRFDFTADNVGEKERKRVWNMAVIGLVGLPFLLYAMAADRGL